MNSEERLIETVRDIARHPRIAFYLGASAAAGWSICYEDLWVLATESESLSECLGAIAVMRDAQEGMRSAAGIVYLSEIREKKRQDAAIMRLVK